MEHKSKRYGFFIIGIILLIGLSVVAYSHLLETKVESQQVLIQKDTDTDVETIASVSKSTAILIICIGLVALLGGRRKKDSSRNLSVKGTK